VIKATGIRRHQREAERVGREEFDRGEGSGGDGSGREDGSGVNAGSIRL
jgi:hypothetical protein